jgi:hypothetical protein
MKSSNLSSSRPGFIGNNTFTLARYSLTVNASPRASPFIDKYGIIYVMSEVQLKQIDYTPSPDGHEVVVGAPESIRGLYVPTIDYEQLLAKYEEGNETYQLITGESGRQYETILFNADKLDKALILKVSTSFSSAYKNPANVIETALAAAANPGAAYLYVASLGNHPTGHMKFRDLMHVARTGRYTAGDGTPELPYRPLGSVEDMAGAIEDHYGAPTHVTSDTEGGRLALGLMTAFSPDRVGFAYLNGLDGISEGAYVMPKLSEDLHSRVRRRQIPEDEAQPGELTPLHIKDVKQRMPAIYSGLGRIAHIAPLPVFLYPRDDFDKGCVTLGSMGHRDLANLPQHAVFQDMEAALRQQPATITLQFNKESAIHVEDDCIRFGKLVMDHLPEASQDGSRRVRLLVGEGTLDYQTDAPQERTRIERHVFPDIMHQMALLAGDVASSVPVVNLQRVRRAV